MDPGSVVKLSIMRRNVLHEAEITLERAPADWFRIIPQIEYAIPL